MIPAAQIQYWAESLAPLRLSSGSVAAVIVLTLLCAALRARRELRAVIAPLVFLGAGAAALELAAARPATLGQSRALWAVAALTWLAHAVAVWRRAAARPAAAPPLPGVDLEYAYAPSAEDPFRGAPDPWARPAPAPPAARLSHPLRLTLAAGFALMALLLFDHLGSYAGTLVHWESPVVSDGFAEAMRANTGVVEYARQRTLWDNGILSRGDTSLFFGLPTYALLRWTGFHPWTLRVLSALATLLATWVVFALGRRFFSAPVGVAAALLFGLNTATLFYGRYGSSIAGTLLAVLLALYAVWCFLERPRAAWWLGAVCALALFAATLQYAPARLFVLFVFVYLPLALVLKGDIRRWQSLVGLLLIAVAAVAVYRYEAANGSAGWFLHARGEQFFELLRNPHSIKPLVGIDVGQVDRGSMTWRTQLSLVGKLLAVTVPQCALLLGPRPAVRGGGRIVIFDPPDMPLYFAPLALLIGLGIAYSLPRWRSFPHLFLLAFPVAYTVPLMLTNRVDPHRAVLLLIPFMLWAALGGREVARMMGRARVPWPLQLAAVLPFAVSLLYADVYLRYPHVFPEPGTPHAVASRIAAIPGSVALGLVLDHRDRSWLDMHLVERHRRAAADQSQMVPDVVVTGLRADLGGPRPAALQQAVQLARRGTLMLGPLPYFRSSVGALQRAGLRVAEEEALGMPLLRADAGAAATGVADAQLRILSPAPMVPTPAPPRMSKGRKSWLTDLRPTAVQFGFAEPRINTTWNGNEVRMGGVLYERAIGTHAWTRMTYAVPPNAVAFEAVVGLADGILACARASVVFEVRDAAADRLLAHTAVVDVETPPQLLVARLRGEKEIVLSVTEAQDGRDCDHANWASPAFVIRAPLGGGVKPLVPGPPAPNPNQPPATQP